MGGDADRLEPETPAELDELRRVRELLVGLLLGEWIAAEREEVLESSSTEASDDLAELEPRVSHARQMRHRREIGRPQKIHDDAGRALARYPSAAVRHGNEGGPKRLQVGD